MRAPTYKLIAGIFFILACALLTLIFIPKQTIQATETTDFSTAEEHPVADYISKKEKENEQEREALAEVDKQEQLAKAKRESAECQFWVQQKNQKNSSQPSTRIEEKIAKLCFIQQVAAEHNQQPVQ